MPSQAPLRPARSALRFSQSGLRPGSAPRSLVGPPVNARCADSFVRRIVSVVTPSESPAMADNSNVHRQFAEGLHPAGPAGPGGHGAAS